MLRVRSAGEAQIIQVKATREGIIGGTTASGWVIDTKIPFVALPAERALWRLIRIRNPLNGIARFAFVLDVGPWNTNDDAYVFGGARPQAESGVDSSGRPTNGSGIDLGEKIWAQLRMTGNNSVEWEFVS
jgi:hypothetical protein